MSDAMTSSDEDTDEEYRRANHHEKYGLEQHHPGIEWFSISWSGSARELITDQVREASASLEPEGCLLKRMLSHESVVQIHTVPQALALYKLITDELNRRQIDGRQRRSLHNARDQLEDEYEERRNGLEDNARTYWDGHKFRSEGEIPTPAVSQADLELGTAPRQQWFARARVKRHLSHRPDDEEIERVVNQLPVMYGLDEEY